MVSRGQPWSSIVSHGHPWPAMGKHGRPRTAMVSHGQACSAMVKHCQPWPAVVSTGQPWSSIVSHGQPRVAMSKRVLSFLASPCFFLDSSCFRFFVLFSFKIKTSCLETPDIHALPVLMLRKVFFGFCLLFLVSFWASFSVSFSVSFFLRSWTGPRRFWSPTWPQLEPMLEPCWPLFGTFLGAALASSFKMRF